LGGAKQAFEPVFNANDAHAVFAGRRFDDGANHGVKARRVAAAG